MKKSGPPRQNARGGKRTAANPRTATGPTGGASKKGAGSATQKVTSKKKTAATAGKTGQVQKKTVWTREDEMARRIQTRYRGYRCRLLLKAMKKKKADYDAMMDKLQREAYVQMVRMEQQRAEAERKREEEERKKQREQARRKARILEAAFDGDTGEIEAILREVQELYKDKGEDAAMRSRYMLVECTDANGNSPLSEAAAGGDTNTIRLLLSLEANPNRKGQYGRTPLYRAAFAGHIEAAKVLLESGADPRITSNDGERSDQVASNPEIEDVFKEWKLEDTDCLLKQLDEADRRRKETQNKLFETIENKLKKLADDAEKECSVKQRELMKAHEELNKRIFEHDRNMATEAVKTDITLAIVHDAEDVLESARIAAEEARKKLNDVRLQLRLKRKEFNSGEDKQFEESSEDIGDVTINIRELDDVLMKDVGNKILDSGKYPLIIDPGKQAATFLRYRDTNYINCCNPRHMEPETLRLALLGAIRYGKLFVLDLLDIDGLWTGVEQRMDLVQKDLLKNILTMAIVRENMYLSLCRESDGEEYTPRAFLGARVHDFKLVVISQLDSLPKDFTEQFYVIIVQAFHPV